MDKRRTNIVNYLAFLSIFFLNSIVFGQKIIYSSLDLNPGGIIHDIAFDSYNDVYIVVGDFNEIGGVSVPNIAFINADDYTLNTEDYFNVITAIDGVINAVEFNADVTFEIDGPHYKYQLFLGGNFEDVTTSWGTFTRPAVVKLEFDELGFFSPMESGDDYLITSWAPNIYEHLDGPCVMDIELFNDTIVIVGNFEVTFEDLVIKLNIAAYSVNSTVGFSGYPLAYDIIGGGNPIAFVKHVNSSIYLSPDPAFFGYHNLTKVDSDGSEDGLFSFGAYVEGVFRFLPLEDDYLVGMWDHTGGGGGYPNLLSVIDRATGEVDDEHSFDLDEGDLGHHFTLALYKDYLFVGKNYPASSIYSYKKLPYGEDITGVHWNANTNSSLNFTAEDHLFVQNNVLFASVDNLTSTLGESRIGLALYCLEPADIQEFTVYDTTICQSDTLIYTVAQADYANGYIWEYTGTGVDIGNTGASENLSDTLYNLDVDAWTRDIRFTNSFTSGELLVTPFTDCNEAIEVGQFITSNTISIPIDTNPLPNAFAGDDTTLTCVETQVVLHGHSDTLDVTYQWSVLDDITMFNGQDTTVENQNNYLLTVINSIGCINYDTVFVEFDTLRPTFDPVVGPFDLTCNDTVRTYLGYCNNLVDITSFWVSLVSHDTSDNPIDVSLPGQYQFYSINNENGCIDSLNMPILVYLNQPSPNINITGYDELPVDSPLDTLDCHNPTLNLHCYSDTLSTVLNWVLADSTDPIGDLINITEGGNYYILAQNTDNGCFNYTGINIAEDFSVPNVVLPVVSSINCSNDSLILDGSTLFLDTAMQWTGDGISPSTNPVSVFDPGWYYLTITKNDNGCSFTDSLEIIADNSIDVFAGNDTIVCDQSVLFLTATYGGDISGITYLWNNGEISDNTFYTGGTDEIAIVEVFGDDDCYGFDSVFIAIPPIPIIEFEGFQPCGSGATGSIIATPISGFAPFEYSIDDGASFQISPAITGLTFGTYAIWVKDSLDCLYEYSAIIDESSALPEPEFLFSTYNFKMDTVIVIDISNPPTDSVNWVFSDEIEYVGDLDGSPLIELPDTGSFNITMDAYYGSCLISVTKEIFVAEFDSTFASFSNQNGIKSIRLFPNPTTGDFTAEVEFYKKQRVSIAVQDMLGYIYEQRNFEEVDTLNELFVLELEAVNGTYVLRIVSEFDSAYITFVLSR